MRIQRTAIFLTGITLILVAVGFVGEPRAAYTSVAPDQDRSPIDLAVTTDGHWAVTANNTSDSVSLVDLENGKVVDEAKVGRRPFGIALTQDGSRAVVTNCWSNSVSILSLTGHKLAVTTTVPVGDEPR